MGLDKRLYIVSSFVYGFGGERMACCIHHLLAEKPQTLAETLECTMGYSYSSWWLHYLLSHHPRLQQKGVQGLAGNILQVEWGEGKPTVPGCRSHYLLDWEVLLQGEVGPMPQRELVGGLQWLPHYQWMHRLRRLSSVARRRWCFWISPLQRPVLAERHLYSGLKVVVFVSHKIDSANFLF